MATGTLADRSLRHCVATDCLSEMRGVRSGLLTIRATPQIFHLPPGGATSLRRWAESNASPQLFEMRQIGYLATLEFW
jgi:hypothetical protein